jgi:hypothetical protein
MERAGYANVSEQEAELYGIVGPKLFFRIVDSAFRVSYWVNLHAEPTEPEATHVNNRREFVRIMLETARKYDGITDYEPASDRQMVENIEKCFREELKKSRKLLQEPKK